MKSTAAAARYFSLVCPANNKFLAFDIVRKSCCFNDREMSNPPSSAVFTGQKQQYQYLAFSLHHRSIHLPTRSLPTTDPGQGTPIGFANIRSDTRPASQKICVRRGITLHLTSSARGQALRDARTLSTNPSEGSTAHPKTEKFARHKN